MNTTHKLWMLLGVLFLSSSMASVDASQLNVTVSIAPQKYFVEQIGKEHIAVNVMVLPGADPHHYEPKPRQMVALSQSQAYFALGIEFESVWLKKFKNINPKLEVVHTDAGIKKLQMKSHGAHSDHRDSHHSHQDHESHGTGTDPHIWLDPQLVKMQAQHIYEALARLDPAHQSVYHSNLQAFQQQLDLLDQEIRSTLNVPSKTKAFMVFHPVWGYFAEAYGLTQIPIEIEGKTPKPAQVVNLVKYARKHNIRTIFIQPQFPKKSAEVIANAIGGSVVTVNPLAEDWLNSLRHLAQQFRTTQL